MQDQPGAHTATEGLLTFPVVVHANRIVTVAALDRGQTVNAIDVDLIVRCAGVDRGLPGDRTFDEEIVLARTQQDVHELEIIVIDTDGHAKARQRVRPKRPIVVRRIATVVESQGIPAALAGDRQQPRIDLVERAVGDRVGGTGIAADTHQVVAIARVDVCRSAGRFDIERFVSGTEDDVDLFQRSVNDLAAHSRSA